MTKRLQLRRVLALTLMVCAAFAGLGYRLVDLQVLRHDELAKLAQDNTQREFWQAPRRGDILDAHGNVLATSVPVKKVWANPALFASQHWFPNAQVTFARTLAPLLQMDEAKLLQQMQPRIYQRTNGVVVTNQYAVLKRSVPEETWRRVQLAVSNLPALVDTARWKKSDREALTNFCHNAIGGDADQLRVYPNGTLAAQVLGFTGVTNVNVDGHVVSRIRGCDGIEFSENSYLSGVAGWRVTETDRQQRELVALRDEDVRPRDGLSTVLTIDAAIQHLLEDELAEALQKHTPRSITGIVVRPQTGEILAMATLPNYDPNSPDTIKPDTRNRVITDVIEPGSTFKVVVVSGALNDGVVHLNDTFDCREGFRYAGRTLHDAERNGILTVEGIITKSSNIGAAQIGIKLGADRLYDYITDYGFGRRTGIPLPGEVRGLLDPVKDWSKISVAQIPFGQGIAVTRLQMVMAMAAIANDGWLMRPMLVSCLQNRDGGVVQKYQPQRVRQVIGDAADKEVVEALKTVVTPEGTAPGAAMKNYVVAGKTGTAQIPGNGGYLPGKFISSFIGFFPADNPQLCISVVMDEPKEGYYGGQVCGPIFKDIAERCASYLNIPPDHIGPLASKAQSLPPTH